MATGVRAIERDRLSPAFAAIRVRAALVAALLVLAAVGWWWSVRAMSGMDLGPWTRLGGLGYFLVTWTVMMYAMMFPSIAPTVALYSRMTRTRAPWLPTLFSVGYLVIWIGAGLLAYALGTLGALTFGAGVGWNHAGRFVAAATLLAAAAYELTPLKHACLNRCRSPLAFLLGCWRDGPAGALQMGAREGAWCLGCCWALMAALFALGVMSITWMTLLAVVIAAEKMLPWRGVATWGTFAVLVVLGILLLASPEWIPALTIPGQGAGDMSGMPGMGG